MKVESGLLTIQAAIQAVLSRKRDKMTDQVLLLINDRGLQSQRAMSTDIVNVIGLMIAEELAKSDASLWLASHLESLQVHQWLDLYGIPRSDSKGAILLSDRVKLYIETVLINEQSPLQPSLPPTTPEINIVARRSGCAEH